HLYGSLEKFRGDFDGDPLVVVEDSREGGNPEDDVDTPSKRLRRFNNLRADDDIESARRGPTGKPNPYFVLVTRGVLVPALTEPSAQRHHALTDEGKCANAHAILTAAK